MSNDRTAPRVDDVVLAEIVERMGQEYESVCAAYGADHVQPPAHYLIACELLALRAERETLAAIVRDVAALVSGGYRDSTCPSCGATNRVHAWPLGPTDHNTNCAIRRAVEWAKEAQP